MNIRETKDYTPARSALLKELADQTSEGLVKMMMELGWMKTCVNCFYWEDKTEICTLYKARPPAKIIALSCPSHEDIPF